MRIVRAPTVTNQENLYRRDLTLTVTQGGAGLVLLLLPLVGLLPNEGAGFWIVLVIGLGLLGSGVWFGRATLTYVQNKRIQDRLSETLARHLNDDYIYFRNLALTGQRSIGEIDGVLLGPPGAIVIQIENYRGEFAVEGDNWYQYGRGKAVKPVARPFTSAQIEPANREPRQRLEDSPTWTAIRAGREVKAWLSVRGLPQVAVQPLVILGAGKIRNLKRPSTQVIEFSQLEDYITQNLLAIKPTEGEPLPEVVVEQIAQRLQTNGD